jgi:hypothetical protein
MHSRFVRGYIHTTRSHVYEAWDCVASCTSTAASSEGTYTLRDLMCTRHGTVSQAAHAQPLRQRVHIHHEISCVRGMGLCRKLHTDCDSCLDTHAQHSKEKDLCEYMYIYIYIYIYIGTHTHTRLRIRGEEHRTLSRRA